MHMAPQASNFNLFADDKHDIYEFPCPGAIHCGRMTHIYVSKQTIIGSDNGL